MAAAPPAFPSDQATSAALCDFVVAATSLFRAAWTLHHPPDDVDDNAADAVETLRSFAASTGANAKQLRATFEAPVLLSDDASSAPSSVLFACSKVSQDLQLRRARLVKLSDGRDTDRDSFHTAQLRQDWKIENVAALGQRLKQLLSELIPSSHDPRERELLLASERNLKLIDLPTDISPGPVGNEAKRAPEVVEEIQEPKVMSARKMKGKAMQAMQMHKSRPRVELPHRPAPTGILNDFVLDSLAYKSMYDREGEVERAHGTTFDWVFDTTHSGRQHSEHHAAKIAEWLATDALGPIYWITGKPGSGKSTLIQYLFHHDLTQDCLSQWREDLPVCMAGFFFWTSGSREQRSQTGLLRSLLHQMLTSHPELIGITFPDLWARLLSMSTKERIQLKLEWTVEDLLKGFTAFIATAAKSMKICLFIDGLDEFEGDHAKIIDLFKGLSTGEIGKAVKMCLSSRPWAVFQEAFQDTVPHLKLQDLTYDDMHRYFTEKLGEDEDVRNVMKKDVLEDKLVRSAIEKADGVFLWIRLAVEQMLGNFQSSPTAECLEGTLCDLPSELDDLFAKLLFRDQTQQQLAEAAVIYRIMRAREVVADFVRDDSATALTVWELAFALRERDDQLALKHLAVEQASESFIQERCESTVAQIQMRFAGLLGLQARRSQGPGFSGQNDRTALALEAAEKRVFYIHRTVCDWLVTGEGVHDHLVECSPDDFDPHLRLLRSYVLRMQRPLEHIRHHRWLDDWWHDIVLSMTHARYVVKDPDSLQRAFLNELDATLSWWWLTKEDDPYDHWARNTFGSYEVRMQAPPIWQPFLCLAVKFGLTTYVRQELAAKAEQTTSAEQLELETSETTPLLTYATEFLCSRLLTIYPLSDPGMVEMLLSRSSRINPGANHEYVDFNTRTPTTPWLSLLKHLRNAQRRGFIEHYDVRPDGTVRWANIVRQFLEAGKADPNALIKADKWDPEITALGVLELLGDKYCARDVQELENILKDKQKG